MVRTCCRCCQTLDVSLWVSGLKIDTSLPELMFYFMIQSSSVRSNVYSPGSCLYTLVKYSDFFWHASYFFLEKGLYFTTSAMQRHDIISLEAMRRAGVDLEENKYCHQTCPLHLKPLQHFQSGACWSGGEVRLLLLRRKIQRIWGFKIFMLI